MKGGWMGALAMLLIVGAVSGDFAHAQSGGKPCYFGQCEEKPRCFFGEDCDKKAEPTAPPVAPAPRPALTLISSRYQDNGDGTVTDLKTHLQWMRCALGQTWNGGTCTGEAVEYRWQAAQDAAYRGWRVPNQEELWSLVYCSSGFEIYNKTTRARRCKGDSYSRPTIDITAFPNTPATVFWSTSAGLAGVAYGVSFNIGDGFWNYQSNPGRVRLVRTGQ